ITWNTQVSGWVQVARSSTPCGRMPPSASTAMIVQCPSTTTVIAAARRKSTTRLRVFGVAASTFRARLIRVLVIGAVPSSVPRPHRHGPLAVTAIYRSGAPGTARRRPRAVLARRLPHRRRVCQARAMSSHHEHGDHERGDPNMSPTDYWEQRYADATRIWSGRGDAARGLENASFTATDLSAWRPDPDSADLVTASFFQSNVELDRIAILRTAASALRSGGHLVVISHASPPPWAGKNGPQLLSARDD